MASLNFIFLPMRPNIFRILAWNGAFGPAHLSLFCCFSLCAYGELLNRGRLLEMRRMCRWKKPEFCVANEGYPLTPWFLIFADSHATVPP